MCWGQCYSYYEDKQADLCIAASQAFRVEHIQVKLDTSASADNY